jgi:class 3 adenylate cyclase/tetratricopeptide (TPR) repeat protein
MSDLLGYDERRTLTVMVIDIVESTPLNKSLDPEDYDDILERLRGLWSESVTGFDGRIMKWTGDGCIAVFGYPKAHDNDAARGVASGLAILDAMRRERHTGQVTPGIRIGIHTGLVLVHQVAQSREFDIVGDTPAIATRIEGSAPPNRLVVGEPTARRVRGEFELQSLGEHSLKGLGDVELWEVLGRREEVATESTVRFVGREAELERLLAEWESASSGERHAVLVKAGPGMGKTRLIAEFLVQLDGRADVLSMRCSELMGTTALYPLTQGLRSLIQASRATSGSDILQRLQTEFASVSNPAAADLLASLLGVPPADPEALPPEPGRRRAQAWEVLVEWLQHRAEVKPCCLVVEDLHWCDPSTAEFLELILALPSIRKLLVLMSTRPEGGRDWAHVRGVDSILLDVLPETDAIAIIEEIAGGAVPNELLAQLLDRSDAVPLFVSELTKAVTESGLLERGANGLQLRGPLTSSDVPASLIDSLMMRLDALGATRGLASAAATIGRTFDAELVYEVTDRERPVQDDLEQMVGAGVLTRYEMPNGVPRYSFSHELLRAAAYESLTRRKRKDLHALTAQALAARGSSAEPTLLAHHYTEAGEYPAAMGAWGDAGRAAFAMAAYDESIANFERGLSLVEHLDPLESWQLELPLQLGMALACSTRFGYVSAATEAAYQRAHELSQNLTGPGSFPAVVGLWAYYQVRSDPQRRIELGRRSHELSSISTDPAVRLEGLSALSTTLAFQGDVAEALQLIDEGLELFDGHRHDDLMFYMPQHPVAGFCAISGPLMWSCGRFRPSLGRYDRCSEFAEHPRGPVGPFTSGYAHTFCAWMCGLRGDYPAVARHAEAAMAIGSEHGFLVWMGAAYPHLGLATAMLGDPLKGVQMISDGISAWRAAGSGLFVTYFQFGLALAYEAAGAPVPALGAVDGGIAHAWDHSERFHLAELHRLRARLLTSDGRYREAAAERRYAAGVANLQGARMFELLALSDLCASGECGAREATRLQELAAQLEPEAQGLSDVVPLISRAAALARGVS